MSSTTGANREANPDDFYATPAWCVDALCDAVPTFRMAPRILDPLAGKGAILKALLARGVSAERLHGYEINAGRALACNLVAPCDRLDFLKLDPLPTRFNAIVTNPPYSLAMECVQQSLKTVGPEGHVAKLLRLAFGASKKRRPFHRSTKSDLFMLSSRPEYAASIKCKARKPTKTRPGCAYKEMLELEAPRPTACPTCGSKVDVTTTDSCDYGWFVWGPGHGGRWEVL